MKSISIARWPRRGRNRRHQTSRFEETSILERQPPMLGTVARIVGAILTGARPQQ